MVRTSRHFDSATRPHGGRRGRIFCYSSPINERILAVVPVCSSARNADRSFSWNRYPQSWDGDSMELPGIQILDSKNKFLENKHPYSQHVLLFFNFYFINFLRISLILYKLLCSVANTSQFSHQFISNVNSKVCVNSLLNTLMLSSFLFGLAVDEVICGPVPLSITFCCCLWVFEKKMQLLM